MTKEFILCAAIYYNDGKKHIHQPKNIETGFVIVGRRHHNCYATLSTIADIDTAIKLKIENIENKMTLDDHRKSQGFITSLDRYVDRKEAWKIAKENNQIKFGLKVCDRGEDSELISENLY